MEKVIGINAVRGRSGGARSHLVGLLNNIQPGNYGIKKVHIWGNFELLARLPKFKWLYVHNPKCSNSSLASQLIWEWLELPRLLKEARVTLLFNIDAGSVCPFTPAVTASRDLLSYEPGEMTRFGISLKFLRLLILKYVQNRSLKKANGVIFLTYYAGRIIQKSCGPLSKVAYIPHGVRDEFKKVRLRPFPNKQRQIRILYISNVAPYKHQWNVVEGVAQLRKMGFKFKLLLVGGGEEAALAKLKESVAKWDPKGEMVEMHPFVEHEKIPAYLAQADLFVFASSCENMPNTLLEAMAAGLPIACSDRGPMPEVLKNGGIYFNPENPDTISAALAILIEDSNQRETLAKRARELASEYSWERCAASTFSFLSTIPTGKT